jgi:hypothetical protein
VSPRQKFKKQTVAALSFCEQIATFQAKSNNMVKQETVRPTYNPTQDELNGAISVVLKQEVRNRVSVCDVTLPKNFA